MIRIDLYITKKQQETIKKLSKEKDISFSEMLRRLLDKQMEEQQSK